MTEKLDKIKMGQFFRQSWILVDLSQFIKDPLYS